MKSWLSLISILLSNFAYSSECNSLMQQFIKTNKKNQMIEKTQSINISTDRPNKNSINRTKFEKLYAQCTSPDKNLVKNLADKNLTRVIVGMSAATAVVGYSTANWQQEKNLDWYEHLGFNLAFEAIFGAFYYKLINDDGNKFKFIIQDYLFGRISIITYVGTSLAVFSPKKQNAQKILKLQESPTFKEDIIALIKYANKESLFKRYKDEVIKYLKNSDEINLGIGVHIGVDFNHLTPSDLNDPDIQKVVIAAIMSKEYNEQKGAISFGDPNLDFLAFDSIYSLAKIPKDLWLLKYSTQVMCLNLNNPRRGIIQLIGIQTINQILFADYYGITYTVLKKDIVGGN